jgi:hypothetical protein
MDLAGDVCLAEAQGAEVNGTSIMPRHRNPPDGDGGPNHWEIWFRDLDGYKACWGVLTARRTVIGDLDAC